MKNSILPIIFIIFILLIFTGCTCESPNEDLGIGDEPVFEPGKVSPDPRGRLETGIDSLVGDGGFNDRGQPDSVPIPIGCAPLSVSANIAAPATSLSEIANKYQVRLAGVPAPGHIEALDYALQKVAQSRPDVLRKVNFIRLYPTQEEYLRQTGYPSNAVTIPEKGEVHIGAKILNRGTLMAAWVVAHELGHIDHGVIPPGRRAESLANQFATQVIGMTEAEADSGRSYAG